MYFGNAIENGGISGLVKLEADVSPLANTLQSPFHHLSASETHRNARVAQRRPNSFQKFLILQSEK